MEKGKFIDTRSQQVDADHMGRALYEAFVAGSMQDDPESAVALRPWHEISDNVQGKWRRMALSTFRAGLSNIHDHMQSYEFAGFNSGKKMAAQWYAIYKQSLEQHGYENNGLPVFEMIGDDAQEAWYDVVVAVCSFFDFEGDTLAAPPPDRHRMVLPEGMSPERAKDILDSVFPAKDSPVPLRNTPPPIPSDEEIIEVRGEQYGDFRLSQRLAGKGITAILESHYQMDLPHEIPGHVVSLIMAQLKILRAALPFRFDHDHYIDARNYITFAQQVRGEDSDPS